MLRTLCPAIDRPRLPAAIPTALLVAMLLCSAFTARPADAAPARGSLTIAPGGKAGDAFAVGATGAAVRRRGGVRFPVVGLALRGTAKATLRGGLRLKAAERRATLRDLRVTIRPDRVAISAKLGGKRRAFLVAEPGARRLALDRATGEVTLRRTAVALTRPGARALRGALGLERLPAGRFGRLAIDAALKVGPVQQAPKPPAGPKADPPAGPPAAPDPFAFCPITAGSGPGTPGGEPAPPAAAPTLASPLAVGAGGLDWGFRAAFRTYVSNGDGNPPISTQGAATINPDGTFRFPVGSGQIEGAPTPRAALHGDGTAVFCYPAHFFRIALLDPTVTIDGGQSRLTMTIDSNLFGTDYGPWRTDVATLATGAVEPRYSNDGQTVTWEDVPVTLTADGASAFAGFYAAGQALDPLTVVAGEPLAAPATWIVSRADAVHDPAQAIGGSDSGGMAISADGRYVAFESYADNLVAGDANTLQEVFVRDLLTRRTTRVSVDDDEVAVVGTEGSGSPQISADGRYVAFLSDAALDASDTNGASDVYVRDTVAGTTALASVAADGSAAGGLSGVPSIAADGRRVAFFSATDGVVAGDADGARDIFVRDLDAATTTLASVGDDESPTTASITAAGGISADGDHVVFVSAEATLAPGDAGSFRDAFVRDLDAATTTLVSVGDDESPAGAHVDLSSTSAAGSKISADGDRVVFYSTATGLVAGDGNGVRDCFLRDVVAGTTVRLNVSAAGAESAEACGTNPTIAADGATVAFSSEAADLVAGDGNGTFDVFVRAAADAATIRRASVSTAGVEDNGPDGSTGTIALGADGRQIGFRAAGSSLTGSIDGWYQTFVRELP